MATTTSNGTRSIHACLKTNPIIYQRHQLEDSRNVILHNTVPSPPFELCKLLAGSKLSSVEVNVSASAAPKPDRSKGSAHEEFNLQSFLPIPLMSPVLKKTNLNGSISEEQEDPNPLTFTSISLDSDSSNDWIRITSRQKSYMEEIAAINLSPESLLR